MKETLALTTILYATGLTVWLVVQAFRPASNPRIAVAALGFLELVLVLLAVLDLASVVQGRRPPDLPVHLAYLGASVAVLPMVLAISASGRKEGRGTGIVPAVGCAAVAVIVFRLQVTGGA